MSDQKSSLELAADAAMARAISKTVGDQHVTGLMGDSAPPTTSTASAPTHPLEAAADAAMQRAMKKALGENVDSPANAPASGPEPKASEPTTQDRLHHLGRQFGLLLRDGAQFATSAAGGINDAVLMPINAGLDAVLGQGHGFRFQRTQDAVDNLLDHAGVAKPENDIERASQNVAQALGGAIGGVGLGKVLATTAAGPLTKAVGTALAAAPNSQIASAVGSAAAQEGVKQLGGDNTAQAGAALLGGLAPALMSSQASRITAQMASAAEKARALGYTVHPKDLNPGLKTELTSVAAGPTATNQAISAENQGVTNALARRALGLGELDVLDHDVLDSIRKTAAKAYTDVAATGVVTPPPSYNKAIDAALAPYTSQAKSFPGRKVPEVVAEIQGLKTDKFDAADALQTIGVLRNDAEAAYRLGDNLKGKTFRQAAFAIEDALDDHLVKLGPQAAGMLEKYRAAREDIARTYTVAKAINPATGDVNAQKLAGELRKGKPLTDELRDIAEISMAFPSITRQLQESPRVSGGGGSLAAVASLGQAGLRKVLLSDTVQDRAVRGARDDRAVLGINPAAGAMLMQGAPHLNPPPEPTPEEQQSQAMQRLGAAQSVDQAISAATEAVLSRPSPFKGAMAADGTFRIGGDVNEIRKQLAAAGITRVLPVRGGVVVGTSQSPLAARIFGAQ